MNSDRKTSSKKQSTHLVDQILTPRPNTNPPAPVLLPLVPSLLQVLQPADEASESGSRAVLETFFERGGFDDEGLGRLAGDLREVSRGLVERKWRRKGIEERERDGSDAR